MATLFQRNGILYINYSLNGKQFRKSTKIKERNLAKYILKDFELKMFRQELGEKEIKPKAEINDTFHRYILYLDGNAVADYINHVKYHLKKWQEFFQDNGILRLEEISVKSVDDFFAINLNSRSPKTKKEYLTSLKACLNRAVKWGLIENNPVREAKPPRMIIRKVRFFSKDEIHHLLSEAPYDLRIAIKVLVNTGMRLGELWALRWKDIDFKNRQIWIRAYDNFIPKGKKDRNVSLNKTCLSISEELDKNRNRNDKYVYRLTRSYKRLSNKFIRFLRKLGLKGRLHDLRHTFASHLTMAGTPLPVVQKLLGHANITTTMVYAHLSPNIHRKEVNRLPF